MSAGWLRAAAPAGLGLLLLAGWEAAVRLNDVPEYVVPGPVAIGEALVRDWPSLAASLSITLQITGAALLAAAVLGLLLAVLFAQSRLAELSLYPYAVILQVTPVVAIAPFVITYVDDIRLVLLICAFIVAFFPVLSNATLGLKSADPNLVDLFRLYRASRWQVLVRLRLPSALPFYLAGLRIAGGLALIGAIVAEFVAGTQGRGSGLASRILDAQGQLKYPRMFAALFLVSVSGIAIFLALSLLSHLLLRRWHDSAAVRR